MSFGALGERLNVTELVLDLIVACAQSAPLAVQDANVGFEALNLVFAKRGFAGAKLGRRLREFRDVNWFQAGLFLGAFNLTADGAKRRSRGIQGGLGLRYGGTALQFGLFGVLDGAHEIGDGGEGLQIGTG